MIILGIETSCDETSAAVLKDNKLLSNVIFSQTKVHKIYGGVVPEIAAREHLVKIDSVTEEAVKNANIEYKDLDVISVTHGPGLIGSLIVGVSYAKGMAYGLKKRITGVNHLEAHLLSPFLEYDDFNFPFLGIVVSGGHTNVYLAEKFGMYKILGETRDDAAGEAFDKVAKLLNLEYPGGPSISFSAQKGDAGKIVFPQSQMKDKSYDFSFSGLKTSVLYYLKNNKEAINHGKITINDIAAGFQKTVARTIVNKIKRICKEYKIDKIALTGGVAANSYLRQELMNFGQKKNVRIYVPSTTLCTDNAAMVAYVGWLKAKDEIYSDFDLEAEPGLKL
ncbi:MAG TPA: tRNA (adenosine(37)-N6)-threonylcarbamoyltransferase complex transferase subunit TsaD [Candidatus Goldiibacteriota bacterium]|nr:tRNA (adenosine(37)-N6)-threonylcarbamoyltransferase complex transferase subunit TsaD [Candidatus Goldiibacteriota bacterium]